VTAVASESWAGTYVLASEGRSDVRANTKQVSRVLVKTSDVG
jgi:hypothetical protein